MKRRECLRWLAAAPLVAAIGCRGNEKQPLNAGVRPGPAVPSFQDVTSRSGLHFVHSVGPRHRLLPEDMGSGLAWGDYDNDGYPDLYVVNQAGPFASGHLEGPGDRLYHNNGNGRFTDVTESAGLEYVHFGMGAYWGDYDNDGLLDLVVVNGNTLENPVDSTLLVPQKPFLFHYSGAEFQNVISDVALELDRPLNARGLAAADFDNDGDMDFAISCNRGPLILIRADGDERANWIKVILTSTMSNRQGIGALVRVSAGGRNYLQAYGSQGSYLSQHATPLRFGLGKSASVDRIEVIWPSGRRQNVTNLKARQTLHLRED